MPRNSSASLYVRNVPDGARIDELKQMFSKYGPVSDVYIPLDYYTRRPRGFAYVQFDDPRDAEDALYNMQRVRYYGVDLEVEFARSDRKSPSTMRSKDRDRGYSPYSGRGGSDRRRGGDRYDDDYDRRRRDRSYSRSPRRRSRYSRSPERKRSYSRSRSRSTHRHYDEGSSSKRRRSHTRSDSRDSRK